MSLEWDEQFYPYPETKLCAHKFKTRFDQVGIMASIEKESMKVYEKLEAHIVATSESEKGQRLKCELEEPMEQLEAA